MPANLEKMAGAFLESDQVPPIGAAAFAGAQSAEPPGMPGLLRRRRIVDGGLPELFESENL